MKRRTNRYSEVSSTKRSSFMNTLNRSPGFIPWLLVVPMKDSHPSDESLSETFWMVSVPSMSKAATWEPLKFHCLRTPVCFFFLVRLPDFENRGRQPSSSDPSIGLKREREILLVQTSSDRDLKLTRTSFLTSLVLQRSFVRTQAFFFGIQHFQSGRLNGFPSNVDTRKEFGEEGHADQDVSLFPV